MKTHLHTKLNCKNKLGVYKGLMGDLAGETSNISENMKQTYN